MKQPDLEKTEDLIQQLSGEYLWSDTNPIGLAIVSNRNVLLQVNLALCRFLGYSMQELRGKTVQDITHPDEWNNSAKKIRQLHACGQPYRRFEKRFLQKNGKTVWGEVNSSRINSGARRPQYRITQVVDITKRKVAEEALLQHQNLHSEAMKLGKIGGWEFDCDTLEQRWTEETYHIHEVDRSFIPTVTNGISFYTKNSKPIIRQAFQSAIAHAKSFDVELEIVTRKNNIRNVHVIGHCDLKYRKVYGLIHDITQRKQDEKKLRESK